MPLWVIGVTQVGVEHLLSAGLLTAGRGFDRDKYGTDFLHKLGVLHFYNPTPLRFDIHMQEAQTPRRVLSCLVPIVKQATPIGFVQASCARR